MVKLFRRLFNRDSSLERFVEPEPEALSEDNPEALSDDNVLPNWYDESSPESKAYLDDYALWQQVMRREEGIRGALALILGDEWHPSNWMSEVDVDYSALEHFRKNYQNGNISPNLLFDSDYYLFKAPDVKQTGINPLLHFLVTGASELRKPHALFDTEFYLK